MNLEIPREYKTYKGIRRVSPVGVMLSRLTLGEIPCPKCGCNTLRFSSVSAPRHGFQWTVACDTCGWELPGGPVRDADIALRRFKRWSEAFALLNFPRDFVEEDLSALFDEKAKPVIKQCAKRDAAQMPIPRGIAMFPCRLGDEVVFSSASDEEPGDATHTVFELGVDKNGCFFRVDNVAYSRKIRSEEFGKSVILVNAEPVGFEDAFSAEVPESRILDSEPAPLPESADGLGGPVRDDTSGE